MKNIFELIILPVFGIFGTLLAILTFVLPEYASIQLDLSVFIISIFTFLLILSIFIKIIINKNREIRDHFYFNNFKINPIQYVDSENVFIIDREISIPLNTAVSIFIKQGYFEKLIGIGFVSHIQEKLIQIKLITLIQALDVEKYLSDVNNLKTITIRPASNINDIIQLTKKESV